MSRVYDREPKAPEARRAVWLPARNEDYAEGSSLPFRAVEQLKKGLCIVVLLSFHYKERDGNK